LDPAWAQATYTTISAATPDRTLTPVLVGTGQVVANLANVWTFTEDDLAVLEDRIAGSGKLSLRTRGDTLGTSSRVTWYSGSATVASKKPTLTLSYTPEPLPDQAPVADAGRSQTLDAPGTVTLDGRGSFDAEGPVSLLWTAHAANPAAVTLSAATVAQPSVTFTVPGTYRFDLAVTDGADVTTTASTFVTVRGAPLPTSASFAYDGDGDRIAMTVEGVTTRFVVDPVPEHARVLAERTGETWTYHVYGHDLLYSVTGSALTVLHSDPLGSTVATTDATGAVTARMRYDVFGERLDSDAATTAYTFAGERMDTTALQYLRARYYDPAVGRFISRDPFPAQAADTQTFNRYVYVKNNPTNFVDPSGAIGIRSLVSGFLALSGVAQANHIRLEALDRSLHPEFQGGADTKNDARRHAWTSKRVAEEVGPATSLLLGIGNEVAGYFGTEARRLLRDGEGWRPEDMMMDMHNNLVGIRAATQGTAIDERELVVLPADRSMTDYYRLADESRRYRSYLQGAGLLDHNP